MKSRGIFTAVVLSASLFGQNTVPGRTMATNPIASALTDGLVGYWTFDTQDISGTTALDRSGQNNNGKIAGATPVSGIINQALSFSNGSYLQATTKNMPTRGSDRTLAGWVKLTSYDGDFEGAGLLFGYGRFYSLEESYAILFWRYERLPYFSQWGGAVKGTTPLELGRWYHIAVTNTGSTVTLYVNGNPEATDKLTMNTVSDGNDFYIGATAETHQTNGVIDDVRIYNRALAPEEIKTLACVGPTITTQPQSTTIASRQTTTLTVGTTGSGALSYQWYQGNAGDTSHPLGTTLSVAMTPTTTTSYWVRVTSACGQADSTTATITVSSTATTEPCLIFVHGSMGQQPNFDWLKDWATGRDYWRSYYTLLELWFDTPASVSAADDFIRTATDGFRRPYFVVRYDGAAPYWSAAAAGLVSQQLTMALDGLPDGGGNSCNAKTGGKATTFWVVTHSMGGTVLDYILGNSDVTSPYPDTTCDVGPDGARGVCTRQEGLFGGVAQRIAGVFSVSGAHKGSLFADLICQQQTDCLAVSGQACSAARQWLQSDADKLVENNASSPAKPVLLFGGLRSPSPTQYCFGDGNFNDAVLQFASQFACAGNPVAPYDYNSLCGNDAKQGKNFYNVDVAFESHDDERNTTSFLPRIRYSIPDGIDSSRSPGGLFSSVRLVQDESTAARINELLNNPQKLSEVIK